MRDQLYESSGRFKAILLGIALVIIVALSFYTEKLVDDLRREAREILQIWAENYASAASSANDSDVNFIFENIIKRTYFPIVSTDVDHNPLFWKGIGIDENDRSPENITKARIILERMKEISEPIPIFLTDPNFDPIVLGYIFHGDSSTITRLRWLPYIEIGLVGMFILVGSIGFTTIKKSEQRFIWVGMSKETAHQLGTPISSLLGWIQILRERSFKRPESITVIDEMEQDMNRLGKVAERFSQIGSMADLRDQNIQLILKNVIIYIQRRLPQMKKTIVLDERFSEIPAVPANADLLEWVFENLIKNSIDAINHENGLIKIITGISEKRKYKIYVDIEDNGRGIFFKNKKNIFRPGFSTKKRGWGLGLNLAKRIIEEYHHGKLIVKESSSGTGTTMRVYL